MELSKQLAGDALKQDPRIKQAKDLLLAALKDHQKDISSIRPPFPGLKSSYSQLLNEFEKCRGSKLYFPYIGSGIGNGPFVELLDGSVKYDFIGGIGPHYRGHSNHELTIAGVDAAIEDIVIQGNLQQNKSSLDFSKLLLEASKLDHCFLSSSGAMANENALKIAFQKRYPATRILAFERCFLGRTVMLSQVTDKPAFREGLPINFDVDYVPFYDHERPEESTENAVAVLKKHLARYPGQHALMCFELVQGEGGFFTAPRDFFIRLIDILKMRNILIFDDEIQSFGRTTRLFAFQHFGLEDYVDIVSIGKLSQVCATLFRKEIAPRPGLLSQTFIGSTSALYAGVCMIKYLLSEGFYGPQGKIQKLHEYFVSKLQDIQSRHPGLIKGPFGIGTMIGFTPYNGDGQAAIKFVHALYEAGLICFVAGSNRVRMLVSPDILTQHIDGAMQILEKILVQSDQQDNP